MKRGFPKSNPDFAIGETKSLLWKITEPLANFAIFLDMLIREFGRRLFGMLPKKVKGNLIRINDAYKAHRNKLLGINSNSQTNSQTNSRSDLPASPDNSALCELESDLELQRGDVPGWVLVVLMTTGLVTALWTIAAPRLSQILKNSLDSMNSIR
jgi:hypothetical protein